MHCMSLVITTDQRELRAVLDEALRADPVGNTIYSAVLAGLDRDDAAGWAARADGVPGVLAARSQQHTPVAMTGGWPDVAELAAAVAPIRPAALAGPEPLVEDLARRLGRPVTFRMRERLFRLDEFVAPPAVPGTARRATPADLDLLVEWVAAFQSEALQIDTPPAQVRTMVSRAFDLAAPWLWCEPDGSPAALAVRQRAVHGASRIGPVYTPPDRRGRGFGTAVTAAAVLDIRAAGAVPCLFTDLGNPTSNGIYTALGFRSVADRLSVRLG